jgi:predicted Zn-dependent protease
MSDKRNFIASAFAVAALTLVGPSLSGCVITNPATGQQDLTPFMSPQEEKRIGAEEHPKMLARFGGVYDDIEIGAYVAGIGGRLVKSSELPNLEFRFTVLNSPSVNAFALPGGYVYVTRGLLALANSEAELAGVLAHEIGHVTARHAAQRYNRAIATSLGTAILGAVVQSPGVNQLAQIGGELFLKGFSREQEFQADTLGVRYMSRVGYDPEAQAAFLRTLSSHSDLERQLVAGRDGRDSGQDFFATHPRTEDRVLKAIAAAQVSGVRAGAPLRREQYLRKMTGLLYGDDPEQGLVRGRSFVHPGLGFAFEVPPGYRLFNTERAVIAKGPEDARIRFDAAKKPTAADLTSYLAQTWARGLTLTDVERITVNGMDAATGRASIRSAGKPADLRLVAVRFSKEEIYRIMMVTPLRIEPRVRRELQRTTYSFRRLTQREAAEYRPFRLGVIAVQPGDTIEALARRMPFDDYQVARFQTLNGLSANARVLPGQQVKIVAD